MPLFRRPKDFADLARLESAELKLEAARTLLLAAGEPMLSAQVSSLLGKTQLEITRARESLAAALLADSESVRQAG
jgi:hypothetical protein